MLEKRVVRIWGEVGTLQVVFTPISEDYTRWRTQFHDPEPKEGYEYILRLFLEDRAGNIGYFATIVFEVDLKCMKVSWHVEDYNSFFLSEDCGEEFQNIANAFGLCK